MSNIFLDPCNIDRDQLRYNAWNYWCDVAYGSRISMPALIDSDAFWFDSVTSDDYNIETAQITWGSQTANLAKFETTSYKAKYTPTDNVRVCLVRFKTKINYVGLGRDTGYEQYVYLPFTNNASATNCFTIAPAVNESKKHTFIFRMSRQDISSNTHSAISSYMTLYEMSDTMVTNANEMFPFITASNFSALKVSGVYCPRYNAVYRDNCLGFPIGFNGWGNTQYGGMECITQLPDTIPVFEETATQAILNYLQSGDDSGRIDPFDPNNPSISKVTDYKTNFKVSLTPASNKNGVKVSVIAYNAQYIAGGDVVAGTCCLHGESKLGTETSYKGIGDNSLPKYPQITKTFDLIVDSTSNRWIYFVFRNVDDVNSHGTWFGVDLVYSDKSASHCKIALVTGGDAINSGSSCTRSSITDGYRYTRTSTGEYVDVVFRAFDMDDLNDPYNDDDDTENTESGSDVDSGVGGKGLRTYAISNTQFEDINTALWSTDWTTVFKSNTINPLNCVMACKSIPFTASAISGGVVTIANLNTNVSANYVTPIKTFSCGSLSLDKYNQDFTDLTHTKVRVYMPYIGWRELPAIEVIGRVAVPKCGLVAHNKTLAFKYIVDFVDGNCRCVISVNGTERYYFDGNCSIDVPVTSDNHTTAVGNAIKAGVQTVMSIGAGVASGVAGNAVGAVGGAISALQSAPNVIPTYQYSATSSPSGYIDASMPQKIIIVIERPVYTVPDNYAHTAGRPCALTLSLGSLTGYTKCANVDISGVSGSDRQRSEVKQLLESGVYL